MQLVTHFIGVWRRIVWFFAICVRRSVTTGSWFVRSHWCPSARLLHDHDRCRCNNRYLLRVGHTSRRPIDQRYSRWGSRDTTCHNTGCLPRPHSVSLSLCLLITGSVASKHFFEVNLTKHRVVEKNSDVKRKLLLHVSAAAVDYQVSVFD
jgi:hypothetical protein